MRPSGAGERPRSSVGCPAARLVTGRERPGRGRTGTLRAQLIDVPARVARSAGRLVLHLPRDWPWEPGFDELFRHVLHDPLPAAA